MNTIAKELPIVIIPMCGIGKRFLDAGIKTHKSLLNIHGRNMIQRIIYKFIDFLDISRVYIRSMPGQKKLFDPFISSGF